MRITKQQTINALEKELAIAHKTFAESAAELRRANDKLQAQLMEARRRTIPFGGPGPGEINFLPMYVESAQSDTDFAHFDTNTERHSFPVARRFRLVVWADMVENPPVVFAGKK